MLICFDDILVTDHEVPKGQVPRLNTSYLTDSYIVFTLKLESGQNVCLTGELGQVYMTKKYILDFPPCGKRVVFVTEFVIFLKISK